MKVYHGSYTKIDVIDLDLCRKNTDFGSGFYVTKFKSHAERWAKIIGLRHKKEGVVTEFDEFIDTEFATSICKIKRFSDYNEEWLDFVVMNRNKRNSFPTHDYDIVEGPVANDKIQNRIEDYLQGEISKEEFLEELKHHEDTHQICFCTLDSLQMLEKINTKSSRLITNISEPIIENLMLNYNFDEEKATDVFYTSKTFTKLSDKSTEFYLKDWSEIYDMLKKEIDLK